MRQQITADTWIEYDDVGQGLPVVLLHAFPLSRAMWRPQREGLGKEYRILTPDLRGFGGSSGFTGQPSVDVMADDVAALLDALKLTGPIVLGGLSMGGYVGLAFARRHAHRLKALILADTKAEADTPEGKAGRDQSIAFARTHSAAEVVEPMLAKLLGEETRATRPGVVDEVRKIGAAQSTAGIIAALQALRDRPEASRGLAAISVQALVMVGAQDLITPLEAARSLAGSIPGAQLKCIEGAGHLSNLEQPERFNAAVQAFLRTIA